MTNNLAFLFRLHIMAQTVVAFIIRYKRQDAVMDAISCSLNCLSKRNPSRAVKQVTSLNPP